MLAAGAARGRGAARRWGFTPWAAMSLQGGAPHPVEGWGSPRAQRPPSLTRAHTGGRALHTPRRPLAGLPGGSWAAARRRRGKRRARFPGADAARRLLLGSGGPEQQQAAGQGPGAHGVCGRAATDLSPAGASRRRRRVPPNGRGPSLSGGRCQLRGGAGARCRPARPRSRCPAGRRSGGPAHGQGSRAAEGAAR